MAAGAWQELWLYTAPVILGDGRPAIADVAWPSVADAPHLKVLRRRSLGVDQLCVYAPT